ncbi:hypothetical protein ABK040_011801 [Willaertia magna]
MSTNITESNINHNNTNNYNNNYYYQQQYHYIPTYKLIIIGDGGVGKTSFINLLKKQINHIPKFEPKYITTAHHDISPIIFNTSKGKIKFNIWDTCGQEKFGGLRDGHYIQTDCAILMFDITFRQSYKNIPTWYKDIVRVCNENIPMVLCGNKLDVGDEFRKVKRKVVTFHKRKDINMEYFEVSVKNEINCLDLIIYLTKRLWNDWNVIFVDYDNYLLKLKINIFKRVVDEHCTDITIKCLQ